MLLDPKRRDCFTKHIKMTPSNHASQHTASGHRGHRWHFSHRLPIVVYALALCFQINSAALAAGTTALVPIPADFPELSQQETISANSIDVDYDSSFTNLATTNAKLLHSLSAYTPDSVATLFTTRMFHASNIHMMLLLAAIAAKHGSDQGRDLILAASRYTDYSITRSRLSALGYLVYSKNPPDWVIDAIHQALADTRQASGYTSFGQFVKGIEVSRLANHLIDGLGNAKNPKSVPVLIEIAKGTQSSPEAVAALGIIGDPRGIPICLELLQREIQMIKKEPQSHSAPSEELLRSLGKLKAKEAVPILLAYLYSDDVIAALGEIGDPSAIAPLQAIVAANGIVDPDPYTWEKRFQKRSFAARMALIKLEPGDPAPKWIAVLQDQSLESTQRRAAVWELGNHPDPRAIPPLIAAINTDPDGAVVNQAITVLTAYPYKLAVAGLIDCFDADFKGKSDWKRAYKPEMFAANIGDTLHTLTGQNFGPDQAQWAKWWAAEGMTLESLK